MYVWSSKNVKGLNPSDNDDNEMQREVIPGQKHKDFNKKGDMSSEKFKLQPKKRRMWKYM